MTFELSGIDIHFLLRELKTIIGGKVEKIYQWKEDFIFRIYTDGEKKHLRINLPGQIYLTQKEYQGPRHPPEYCMFLRKYIQKATITNIEQKELDRIVIISFNGRKGEYKLVIELLSPGNVALCKNDLQIVHPLNTQKFSNREIRSKKQYEFPPKRKNPLTSNYEELKKEFDPENKIVVELASKLGLGGTYSEEVLTRTNTDFNQSVQKTSLPTIFREITNLLNEKINANKSKQDLHPIKMQTQQPIQTYKSFNQAIDENTDLFKTKTSKSASNKSPKNRNKKEKLKVIIQAQTKQIKRLEEDIAKNQSKAEKIYEKYQDFANLIDYGKKLIEEKGVQTAKKELLKQDFVTNFNPKTKTVTVNINE